MKPVSPVAYDPETRWGISEIVFAKGSTRVHPSSRPQVLRWTRSDSLEAVMERAATHLTRRKRIPWPADIQQPAATHYAVHLASRGGERDAGGS